MKITYLGHSGFLVETRQAYYLFDYIRGQVPAAAYEKPLYVFVSHSHGDHFSQEIFNEAVVPPAAGYILSDDIRKKFRKSPGPWLKSPGAEIFWAKPGSEIGLCGCRVLPLRSTDLGVAYLVDENGLRIYHAGDLNWWHWEGEAPGWNRNMEVNYKREIDRLKGIKVDLAFIPLDPRLGEAYWYGMEYFMRTVSPAAVFPMHFWEDYGVIGRYLREHGGDGQIQKIEREGQEYEI